MSINLKSAKKFLLIAFSIFLIINYISIILIAYFQIHQYQRFHLQRQSFIIHENISQTELLAETINDSIYASAIQLFNSPMMIDLKNSPHASSMNKLKAMRELNAYISASSFCHSAYVYNPFTNQIYSTEENFPSNNAELFSDYEILPFLGKNQLSNNNKPYYRKLKYHSGNVKPIFSYIIKDQEGGILILNINFDWLETLLKTNSKLKVEVQNENGTIMLLGSNLEAIKKDLQYSENDQEQMHTITSQNNINNQTLQHLYSQKFQTNYYLVESELPKFGLKFFYYIDEKEFFADVIKLKQQIISFLIALIMVFGILQLLIYKYLVTPLGNALSEMSEFNLKAGKPIELLRLLRIRQWLYKIFSDQIYDGRDFVETGKSLGINIEDRTFIILAEEQNYHYLYESLVKCNLIVIEYKFAKLNFYICQNPNDDFDNIIDNKLKVLITKLPENRLYLIGKPLPNWRQLNKSFNHLLECYQLRQLTTDKILTETNLLVRSKQLLGQNINSLLKLCTDSQLTPSELDNKLNEWLSNLKNYRLESLTYILRNLTIEIKKTLISLDLDVDPNIELINPTIDNTISVAKIKAILIPIMNQIQITKQNKQQEHLMLIVDQVQTIIENELNNPNLSLKMIAAELNLSPTYLGKIFKNSKRISISTMINKQRLQLAAELLKTTNLNHKEICLKIGLTNPAYFYSLFKKEFNLTPNEFRGFGN